MPFQASTIIDIVGDEIRIRIVKTADPTIELGRMFLGTDQAQALVNEIAEDIANIEASKDPAKPDPNQLLLPDTEGVG